LTDVGTSNGIGWSLDGKTMCTFRLYIPTEQADCRVMAVDYIDSAVDEISKFDYGVSTGIPSNRRLFAKPPPPLDADHPTQGVFDGLTVDGAGNVWAARWKDSRVVGFRPDGSLICHIRCGGCKCPTIPCFGGEAIFSVS